MLVQKTKEYKMKALLLKLQKKVIDQYDRMLADDYMTYYGIDADEAPEYADEFVSVCYKYNEETYEHERRNADELPFATVTETDNTITYEYNGQRITKMK